MAFFREQNKPTTLHFPLVADDGSGRVTSPTNLAASYCLSDDAAVSGTLFPCGSVPTHISGGVFSQPLTATETDDSYGGVSVRCDEGSTYLPLNMRSSALIADFVWDESRAEHAQAGSFGEGVSSVTGSVLGTVSGKLSAERGVSLLVPFKMFDANGNPTPGITPTVLAGKDLGAFAACANAVTESGYGAYGIQLTATEMDAGTVSLVASATGYDTTFVDILTED